MKKCLKNGKVSGESGELMPFSDLIRKRAGHRRIKRGN